MPWILRQSEPPYARHQCNLPENGGNVREGDVFSCDTRECGQWWEWKWGDFGPSWRRLSLWGVRRAQKRRAKLLRKAAEEAARLSAAG